ncbi:hypothetical protein ACFO9Q_10880 [Paenibacillus sp. GCM10023252]|uniref:hypothetical protein n=1 Tax=Paenibacillus sp. GCM10023252 TaxID=3252649 RepID=UPI0036162FC9
MNTRTLAEIPESRINDWRSMMPYIRPVITNPYYESPIWIEDDVTRKEFICLSSDSTVEEVELFLILLFGFNNIDPKLSFTESFNEILNEESVAISGGIAFFEDENNYIIPSCCSGLEDWEDLEESVVNRSSPWLGHDPSPGITYQSDHLFVWPDDPNESNNNLISIKFTIEEMLENIKEVRADLKEFIQQPLFQWIKLRDVDIAARMSEKMIQWFIKN